MRRSVWIIAAALLLAPLMAAQAAPVVVELTYLGQGQYLFRNKQYDYRRVVKVIQNTHPNELIDLVSVNMPQGTTLIDRKEVCGLRQALNTQVKMHLDVGDGTGTTAPQFCN
ncbi:MAG TPA: hypothetical protein VGH91_10405 [Gammaproteobacteria bacterium]|jgi:hypothetical protein